MSSKTASITASKASLFALRLLGRLKEKPHQHQHQPHDGANHHVHLWCKVAGVVQVVMRRARVQRCERNKHKACPKGPGPSVSRMSFDPPATTILRKYKLTSKTIRKGGTWTHGMIKSSTVRSKGAATLPTHGSGVSLPPVCSLESVFLFGLGVPE